ncbi:MAG: PEGA domain-containing protein [Spirochaetales bacterium]|jgi:hypothetical protein|nr:PEGA domain-containing protein [Spirochaetales bacterium]
MAAREAILGSRAVLLFLALPALLPAQTAGEALLGPPPAELKIGVCEFTASSLPAAYRNLGAEAPRRLIALIQANGEHALSPGETAGLLQNRLSRAREALLRETARLRAQRDELFFSAAPAAELSTLETRLLEQEEKLRLLEGDAPGESLPIPESLPLAVFPSAGGLLPPLRGNPAYYPRQDLDFILHGSLEEAGEFFFLSWEIYSFFQGERVFRSRQLLGAADIAGLGQDQREFRTWLLGREWADLVVILNGPENGEITVDGSSRGLHRLELPGLRPGEHRVQAGAPGFFAQDQRISLLPGERRTLELTLLPQGAAGGQLRISTRPAGAAVYLDSRLAGLTPALIDLPLGFSRLLLRKEGFRDYSYFLDLPRPAGLDLTIPLSRGDTRRTGYQSLSRQEYYRSLGIFFLSVPLTLFFYSSYGINFGAYRREYLTYGATAEAYRFYDLSHIYYYGTLASLGINVILLVNTGLTAYRYVRAAGLDFKAP